MLLACKLFEVSSKLLLSLVGAGVEELVLAFAGALDGDLAAEAGNASLDGDGVDGDSASQTISESTVSGGQMQASIQGGVSEVPDRGMPRHVSEVPGGIASAL